MINIVLSIYEIWPTLSYPFFRIWSTLSYLFIKLINLVLSIYEFEDWSATWLSQSLHQKTFPQPRLYPITILSTNMNSLNQHQWFFLSTSTANENSHQHQLQPITMYIIDFSHWVDSFSYLTPFILSTEVKWLFSPPPQATTLECCFGDPKTCMSRLQKRYFFSRLLVWHSPKDRSSGVLNLNVLSVLLQAEKHFNIVQTFKMFEKKKLHQKRMRH